MNTVPGILLRTHLIIIQGRVWFLVMDRKWEMGDTPYLQLASKECDKAPRGVANSQVCDGHGGHSLTCSQTEGDI